MKNSLATRTSYYFNAETAKSDGVTKALDFKIVTFAVSNNLALFMTKYNTCLIILKVRNGNRDNKFYDTYQESAIVPKSRDNESKRFILDQKRVYCNLRS